MAAKISFCITCKNRFHQISRTLGINLRDNRENKDLVEFIVVDFSSTDSLQDWIPENFSQELSEGYLKYFYTTRMPDWNASIAKNTAHFFAQGEFLMNLDCDNFTGPGGGKYAHNKFLQYGAKTLIHQFSGNWGEGTYGRIGMHRKYFWSIGGYDESFESMGHQDVDLINRLHESGLTYRNFTEPAFTRSIPNEKSESIKYSNSSLSWAQMEVRNAKISKTNIYSGRLRANNGVFGIRKDVWTYKGGKMIPYQNS